MFQNHDGDSWRTYFMIIQYHHKTHLLTSSMPNMSESGGTQIAPEAPKYKYDRVRLKTFQSWPANAKVEAWKMARIGR